jgi:hypothetical protein
MRDIAEKMLDNTHFPRASRGFRGKTTNFVSFFALSNRHFSQGSIWW